VVPGRTGLLFDEPTPEALMKAVDLFERIEAQFVLETIVAHAACFSKEQFKRVFRRFVDCALAGNAVPLPDRCGSRSGTQSVCIAESHSDPALQCTSDPTEVAWPVGT
jgi:hypothetical protein